MQAIEVLVDVDLIVILIISPTDTAGFEPDGPDFPLYKNSRLKERSAIIPDAATNCSAIEVRLSKNPCYAAYTKKGPYYLMEPHHLIHVYNVDMKSEFVSLQKALR